ncbi:hypothetical protein SAMN04489761_2156 [Tenacibaculum sp. MAR_2009_124]|uniref:hypothetical protein n=1 Tax=Tenacibaculum sp. MAR_2009_124 TaxID=1250059 RepID=UPI000897A0F0|nr:hypothetical protein [Tenacibaculum sp. MAR_2009_124]SEB98109.1 hypothetical protein SAMN04489761_2156 [Tenacibaculum sp. MAR_2009_124]
MIKKITYSLFVIIIIVFTVGYFRYNPTVNISNTIPKAAKKVVRMNLRELEYTLLMEYVFNPSLIFQKGEGGKKKEKKISLFKQIEIPPNLFFYSFSNQLNDAWYSSEIVINDKKKLEAFFKEQSIQKTTYNNILTYRVGRLIYTVYKDKLVLILTEQSDVSEVLKRLLSQQEYLGEKDLLLESIQSNEVLISGGTVEGDFIKLLKDGTSLNLTGKWSKFESLLYPERVKASENTIVGLYGKINAKEVAKLISDEQKKKLKKITTIELDSITEFWNGELKTQVLEIKSQYDTIVSYDYDDDFNKVEKKEVQEKKVPISKAYLGGVELYSYLKRKSFIKSIEATEVLTLNPFFETKVMPSNTGVLLTSGEIDSLYAFQETKLAETKFILQTDFKSLNEEFSFRNNVLKNLKRGSIKIDMNNMFKVNLSFSETPINSLLKGSPF